MVRSDAVPAVAEEDRETHWRGEEEADTRVAASGAACGVAEADG
jgi:hypothetical protein